MFNPTSARLLVKSITSKTPRRMRLFDIRLIETAICRSLGQHFDPLFCFLLAVCLLSMQSAGSAPADSVVAVNRAQSTEKAPQQDPGQTPNRSPRQLPGQTPDQLPDQSPNQLHAHPSEQQLYQSLGQLLFFDPSLSKTGNQSCSSCHEPSKGFVDTRISAAQGAVSLGDDNQSFGSRNTPGITYAALTPAFRKDSEGYLGGFFLDGRALTLEDQAIDPFINPIEMALPDHAALVEKLLQNAIYRPILKQLLGDSFAQHGSRILDVTKRSLAAFQRGAVFSSFDSKYDRYLAGEETLTAKEERGRSLFFSQLVNCSNCHLLNPANVDAGETFTNYRYHNIGIPANKKAIELAADRSSFPDLGLYQHPDVTEETEKGKFKVPSLRNVAVTAPYMHNGVFKKLETAVHYYNQFIVNNRSTRTNPETGQAWAAPEVNENLSRELLRQGQPMDQQRLDAIVAFLKTLTDKRYEALLQ
jgi:cytochrome c peroxidase